MSKAKLELWAKSLLDTSKRSNLINFKDWAASTVEVVFPSSDKILEAVEEGKTLEVFDSLTVEDDDKETLLPWQKKRRQ